MKVIDLSLDVYDKMPVYPGDPSVFFMKYKTIDSDGYNLTQILLGSHTGTHLDVPLHFVDGGDSIEKVPPERFIGEAYLIDLSYKKAAEDITPDDFKGYEDKITPGVKLLLRTDWYKALPEKRYFKEQPRISYELAKWFVERGVSLIGLETPTINPVDNKKLHQTLLAGGIIVVEALAHLDQVTKDKIFFIALPLKIRGGDGSPVRAVAIEEF
ncbi:MAG: cyclase family protein [bacterium]